MNWWRNERESSTFSQVLALYFPNFFQSFQPLLVRVGAFIQTIMLTEKFEIKKADNGYILREDSSLTVHLTDTTLYKELLAALTETLNTPLADKVSVTITIE